MDKRTMTDKNISLSEDAFKDIMDNSINWSTTGQVITYLATGLNGMSAQDTLRIGRQRLARHYENLEHDANCWQEIADRADASDYIREFATLRAQAIRRVCEKAHQRFDVMTEGRE